MLLQQETSFRASALINLTCYRRIPAIAIILPCAGATSDAEGRYWPGAVTLTPSPTSAQKYILLQGEGECIELVSTLLAMQAKQLHNTKVASLEKGLNTDVATHIQ